MMRRDVNISDLRGKTLTSVERDGNEKLTFVTADGETYYMYHRQDCYESVTIEDICGDLNLLVGSPIVLAEEISNSDDPPQEAYTESYTWTFYKLGTAKGAVTICWYSTSNGYYSESVDFVKEIRVD